MRRHEHLAIELPPLAGFEAPATHVREVLAARRPPLPPARRPRCAPPRSRRAVRPRTPAAPSSIGPDVATCRYRAALRPAPAPARLLARGSQPVAAAPQRSPPRPDGEASPALRVRREPKFVRHAPP